MPKRLPTFEHPDEVVRHFFGDEGAGREQVWHRLDAMRNKHPVTYLSKSIVVRMVMLVAVVLLLIFATWSGIPDWSIAVLILGFAMLIWWCWTRLHQPKDRSFCRRIAEELDLRPIRCFDCDYDLRHIDSATCPECGSRVPGVQAADGAGP
ncbi:MAG: hypothetical protein AAGB29_01815 [Planctomycetota bacterium]